MHLVLSFTLIVYLLSNGALYLMDHQFTFNRGRHGIKRSIILIHCICPGMNKNCLYTSNGIGAYRVCIPSTTFAISSTFSYMHLVPHSIRYYYNAIDVGSA